MKKRSFRIEQIEQAWEKRSVIWFSGVRRVGKTFKFRDTLTGRKESLWLTPIVSQDLVDFGKRDLAKRLLFGGLPPFKLSKNVPERDSPVVAADVEKSFIRHYKGIEVKFVNHTDLIDSLKK